MDPALTLTQDQLDTLCRLAREAGAAILRFYCAPLRVQEKADLSPLTEADLAADAVIRTGLETAFPGIFIVSEESTSPGACGPDAPFFLVDPLDGTKEFLNRNGEFTVNIALVEGGRLRAGVVYAPVPDCLYFAAEGLGAFVERQGCAAEPIRAAPFPATGELRVVGSRSHGCETLFAWLEALKRPYTLVQTGSSLKFCRIAEGEADLYPRFGPTSQWDTAAGQCVLEIAGGSVRDMEGRPLAYARDRAPLNPDFLARGA